MSAQHQSWIAAHARRGARAWRVALVGAAASLSLAVPPAQALTTTTTALTSSVNPSAVGQATSLKATVSPSTSSGTVTFKDGTTTLGTGTLASGVATYSATFNTTGAHSVTAVYGGNSVNATSTSSAVSQTVNKKTTTTVLTSSVNPNVLAQATTLKATVTPSTATGTVTFKDGAATLGTGTIASGIATYAATFSTTGAHTLTAVYAGDALDAASTSASVAQTVNKKPTTTALTSSVNPAAIGQATSLKATISPTTATGTVTFKDGTATLGTGTLASGVATYSATFSTAGAHSLTAVYGGDASDATSTSAVVAETINKNASTTALTSSVNPSQLGQATSLKATITPATAAGTVTFKDGTTTLGTGTIASGVATYSATFNATGAHSLTAVYAGDANDNSSTSSAVAQTVSIKTTTTALTSSANPSQLAQATTLKATITPSTATGTVTFKDGTTTLGTGTVASGIATYSATFGATGAHSLTAVYGGDASDATSTSNAVSQTVNLKTTTTAIASSVNPSLAGSATVLKATVTPSTATGTVTFKDGTTTLGTGTLVSGVANYSATFSTTGSHSVTAVYAGDASDATSTSTSLTQTVNPSGAPVTTTSLVPSANPSTVGASLTLVATITGNAPTGTIQFKDGATNLGAAVTVASGRASTSVTPGAIGGHAYSAVYSGDPNNAASTGQAAVNVAGNRSTTSLTSSAGSATPATSLTFTAAIAGASPTGSVTFRDGATTLGTATLASASATLSRTLATGLHTITATYAGDATNSASMSTAVLVQVSADGSTPPPSAALQTSFKYDAEGNLTQITDANSATTTKAYDSLSRATTITQPAPAPGASAPKITVAYDLQDQPAAVTDPRALTTSYTTSGLGVTTTEVSPDTGTTTRTFYVNGLLKTSQDARGRVATYTYDPLDRLLTISYPTGTGTVFVYDQGANSIGQLSSVTDESGSTSFAFDGLGRVVTKTQTVGPSAKAFTLGYTWGTTGAANGKMTKIQYPSGASVSYGYDSVGRVNAVSVTGADGVVTPILGGLAYTALGQAQSWAWGVGGVPYQRAFDGYGRLVSYPLGNPAGAGLSAGVTRTLAFDAAGRIVGYSHTTPTNSDQIFNYDDLDRLVGATLTGGNAYGYAYDATGNRTQSTINGTTYALAVSPTSNRYTNVATAAGATNAQGYDAAGHLQSEGQGGTYTYSDRGRLSGETRATGTFNYLYNAFEQRTYKSGPSAVITTGTAYYVYDEAGHLVGEYDATGKAVYETVYLGDVPVAALTQPALGQTTVSYAYADHLNTARVLVRPADQAIVWTWGGNEPFGQTQANSNPSGLGAFTYNPRFPGQVADVESGWFYNWNRDYNPALGRYTESDPIGLAGGSMSTYAYAGGTPLTRIDATGLLDGSNYFKPIESLLSKTPVKKPGITPIAIAIAAFEAALAAKKACDDDDACDELIKQILDASKTVQKRLGDMYIDKLDLKAWAPTQPSPAFPGQGSWNGHLRAAASWQRRLSNLINDALSKGCIVPEFAWTLANIKLPPALPATP